jgi:hypothetical protein
MCLTAFAAAQEEASLPEAPAEENTEDIQVEAPKEKPRRWYEYLHGLSFGVEAGAHEYPLDIWYPGAYISGYSVRSLYITPALAYEKTISDFHFRVHTEVNIDLGAPDPKAGASAMSAKTADRQDWYTVYVEENFDYPVSRLFKNVNFPGTLSVFLNHENYIYAYPEFPEVPGVRPHKGNIADGIVEFGPAAYDNNFPFGRFYAKLGLPLSYLVRYSDELGFGMNITMGWHDTFGIGLGVELGNKVAFIPGVLYSEMEFIFNYEWKSFTAELKVNAYNNFDHASVTPELRYRLDLRYCIRIGAEISGLGKSAAFSPYLGFTWSY